MKNKNNTNTKVIIFNGDDTLWECFSIYKRAKYSYAKFMQSIFPNDPLLAGQQGIENFIKTMDIIDGTAVVYTKSFNIERLKFSMLYMYNILADRNNIRSIDTADIKNKIDELAEEIHSTPIILFKDTIPALNLIKRMKNKDNNIILVLYSFASKRKMATMPESLKKYFDFIVNERTSDTKDYKYIKQLVKDKTGIDIPYKNMTVVGNSIRYDINPALELGTNALFIKNPEETGKYLRIVDRSRPLKPIPTFSSVFYAVKFYINKEKSQQAEIYSIL